MIGGAWLVDLGSTWNNFRIWCEFHALYADAAYDRGMIFFMVHEAFKIFSQIPERSDWVAEVLKFAMPNTDEYPHLLVKRADAVKLQGLLVTMQGSKVFRKAAEPEASQASSSSSATAM